MTENWPVVVTVQLLPTPYYSGQNTSELLFYYFIGRNTLMRWRGILFWNFSVFQVSKSIKSGAWWPIVWRFCENYFSQKVHCDIRFIPKSTVKLSDKSRKIQSHQKQSQFWKYLSFDLHILTQKCIVYSRRTWHILNCTRLGYCMENTSTTQWRL